MVERSITLYCTEGGSDKVYKIEVAGRNGGYVVNFWYGPRTGTHRPGTKTASPVNREKAFDIYDKLVRSKERKGYHEGVAAPAYTESDGTTRDSGDRPMLLNPDTEENIEKYIKDDAWGAQEKMNGTRLGLKTGDSVVGINKKGLEISIPQSLHDEVAGKGPFDFDGELKGEIYYAFDLRASGPALGQDHSGSGYDQRHELAGAAVRTIGSDHVKLVGFAIGEKAKRALVKRLYKGKKEGVVFKHLAGKYEPGLAKNLKKAKQVKIKFWTSGEFIVRAWNNGRQSLALEVYNTEGALVSVGNVTVPNKWVSQVKVGGVIQVRYLYATDGHQLYQPNLDGSSGSVRRDDKSPAECLIDQLKYEGKD